MTLDLDYSKQTSEELRYFEIFQTFLSQRLRHKLAIPTTDGYEFVVIKQVVRLQAEGNYTRLMLLDGSNYLVSKTLMDFDKLLEKYNFFRIHRSHLINLTYLKRFCKGRKPYVLMTNGDQLSVSTRKKEDLRNCLNMFFEKEETDIRTMKHLVRLK